MPPASGCITSRLRSSFCIFRIISRRCLRFISCQWCCVGWLVALLFCSSGLDFMLTFLCRIQLGSARLAKTTQPRQRGRAVLLFRTTPAAIYTIARTGAMLLIGQERSRENAALAAEPSCALDFILPNNGVTGSATASLVSQTTNDTINFNTPVVTRRTDAGGHLQAAPGLNHTGRWAGIFGPSLP